jgi:hypothetical protein
VSTGPDRAATLVGRDAELALLVTELDLARAGELRCVALLGEPGIGKTRLARELAGRGGVVDLSARAYPSGASTPFGLWSEAFERHLRGLDPQRVSELCSGFLDDLAVLLRSVAAVRGGAPEGEQPRARLLEGLAVLLGNLARSASVVLLLDDMHLADASSWEALSYLARTLADARVLVVVTARPAELAAQPVGTEVLLGLEQEGLARRLRLEALPARRSASWPPRSSRASLRRPWSTGWSPEPAATRCSRSGCCEPSWRRAPTWPRRRCARCPRS